MKKLLIYLSVVIVMASCEDFVTQEPVDQILTDNAIIDAASADQAVLGAYSRMQTAPLYGDNIFLFSGVLSDELQHSGSFPTIAQMDINKVGSANTSTEDIWQLGYTTIFQCNNILEILETADFGDLSEEDKTKFIGEARFIRAMVHFTLANFYGNVPLVETTDVVTNSTIGQASQAEVYAWVISQASEARGELPDEWLLPPTGTPPTRAKDFRTSQHRATSWVAMALEARAQLYAGNATAAAALADNIITNGPFKLESSYSALFAPTGAVLSNEIIFAMFYSQSDPSGHAFQLLPKGRFEYAVGDELAAAHENDPRALWVLNENDSEGRSNVTKYSELTTNTDNSIIFRLAEMYLIRAEGGSTAVADINALRTRAGADAYAGTGSLTDILNERFIELSFEGHRWFDIVRTGEATTIMAGVSGSLYTPTAGILPIPQRDVDQNGSLTQNPGY